MKKSIVLMMSILFIAVASGFDYPAQADECAQLDEYPTVLKPRPDTDFTGPYDIVIEGDPDFPTHTIFRPVFTSEDKGKTFPLLAWGEGGCAKFGRSYSEMMGEVASYGIIVIADGGPRISDMFGGDTSPGGMMEPTGEGLIMGIDYAFDKNDNDPCSPLYGRVDKTKVGISGQSCGGLLALSAAADPRVTVTFIMSSGLFTSIGEYGRRAILPQLHTPVIYLNGGPDDVAYAQAEKDVDFIDRKMDIPLYWVNSGIGHMADILTDNGGTFGTCLVDWLRYQFFDEQAFMFEGDNCGYCQDDDHSTEAFTVNKYNGAK